MYSLLRGSLYIKVGLELGSLKTLIIVIYVNNVRVSIYIYVNNVRVSIYIYIRKQC